MNQSNKLILNENYSTLNNSLCPGCGRMIYSHIKNTQNIETLKNAQKEENEQNIENIQSSQKIEINNMNLNNPDQFYFVS